MKYENFIDSRNCFYSFQIAKKKSGSLHTDPLGKLNMLAIKFMIERTHSSNFERIQLLEFAHDNIYAFLVFLS